MPTQPAFFRTALKLRIQLPASTHHTSIKSTLIPKVTDHLSKNSCLVLSSIVRSQTPGIINCPFASFLARRQNRPDVSFSQSLQAALCRLSIREEGHFSSSAIEGRRDGPTFHLRLRLLLRDLVGLVNGGLDDLLFFRRESVSQLLVECWLRLGESCKRRWLVYCGPPIKKIMIGNLH